MILVLGSLVGVRSSQAQYRIWQEFTSSNLVEYGRFGGAIAGVGDVGGDDVRDVIVGAALEPVNGANNAGRAYVLDGGTGDILHTLTSPNVETGGLFGGAVSRTHDITGDGVPDLLVGAEGETVNGFDVAGRVYLFNGATGAHVETFQSTTPRSYARFGASIDGVSDVNNDGTPEVLVGAFVEYAESTGGAGRVYLFDGDSADTLRTAVSNNPERYGLFGAAVSSVDDVSGDGIEDILVGAPGETAVDSSQGRAYLLSGSDLNHQKTFVSPNDTTEGNFGRAVAGVGDVDEDGTPEVAVGAPGESVEADSAGRAYVFDVVDNTVQTSLTSPTPRAYGAFGSALVGLQNIDGGPGLAVGAPGDHLNDVATGRVYILRGADGTVFETLSSPNPEYNGNFGITVADVGHVDTDRLPDVAVGANLEGVNDLTQAGSAYMFTEPPDPPFGVTVEADSVDVDMRWDPADVNSVAEYRVYRDTSQIDSTAGPESYTAIASLSSGTTSYLDTSAVPEATNHYRVTAVNDAGVESSFSTSAREFLYPGTIVADTTRSFGDANAADDYRLVALPGAVSRSLATTMSGEWGVDWQAYWDDGTSSGFLHEADGSDTFEFRPGRGFWVTSTSDWNVEMTIPTVSLQGDTATAIDVHDGWNIISNPLGRDVEWSAVERATGTDLKPLWEFGNAFAQTPTFASATEAKAYYFRNHQGLDSLRIPHPGVSETTEKAAKTRTRRPFALTARPEGQRRGSSTVRVRIADSESAHDESGEIVAPPSHFSTVSLRIENESGGQRGRLAQAVRRSNGEGHTFSLQLRNQTSAPIEVQAQHLDAAGRRETVLLHSGTGEAHDLRRDSTVLLSESRQDSLGLELVIGTKQYVEEAQKRALPDDVVLRAYPNPVRDQATLSYSLPEKREVRLVLYDVLGRQVKVLAKGRKRAGQHRVQVEASRLASGVYFGRLRAGQERRLQKITILR